MNIHKLKKALGVVVRRERLARGLSLRDLEEQNGLNKSLISRVENGSANLCLNSLIGIAWVFDMDAAELVRRAEYLANRSTR